MIAGCVVLLVLRAEEAWQVPVEVPEPLAVASMDETESSEYSNVEPEDYVGPEACRSCHETPHVG